MIVGPVLYNAATLILVNLLIGAILALVPRQDDRVMGTALSRFRVYFLVSALGFLALGIELIDPDLTMVAATFAASAQLAAAYLLHAGFCGRARVSTPFLRNGAFALHAFLLVTAELVLVARGAEPLVRLTVLQSSLALLHAATLVAVGSKLRKGNAAARFSYAALLYTLFTAIFTAPAALVLTADAVSYYDLRVLAHLTVQLVLLGGIYSSYLLDAVERHYEESMRDPVTGLHNRRYFYDAARSLLASASRHDYPVSVILCDIDRFKSVNDRFGHDVGDQALIAVARVLEGTIRAEDTLARFGGEEFVLLLPRTGPEAGAQAAERMRARCEALALTSSRGDVRVTASFGVASVNDFTDIEIAIRVADTALYKAKEAGRNRVVVADEPVGGPPRGGAADRVRPTEEAVRPHPGSGSADPDGAAGAP